MRFIGILVCLVACSLSARAQERSFFHTSDQCIACHSGMVSSSGQDISIGYTWRASMMANSARDPYWQAGVRRELMDHPTAAEEIGDTCARCHLPMARFHAVNNGQASEIFPKLAAGDPLAVDGVSCTVCHQIRNDNFGDDSSFTGGFIIDATGALGERQVFGPHSVDNGRQTLMLSSSQFMPQQGTHLAESELCATCHTLFTNSLDEQGEEVGAVLAEQVPYLEWLHSDFGTTHSCQDCHMPVLAEDAPITSVLGQPRPEFSQHVFRGGNAFMIGILNKHRNELGVTALPQELEATARSTREFLQTETAQVRIESAEVSGTLLELDVAVESLSGHKLPTGYASRRVWLHVTVTDDTGNVVFESGALRPNGSILGNANDDDGTLFEPHYQTIERPDQVQIYEDIMVDYRDRVTTSLLSGVRYVKDNRLLPAGFDKDTATWEIAVTGNAAEDGDFAAGGDRVRYRVSVGDADGELTVEVALEFQSVGYRWAENLRAYDAPEPNRFLRFYEGSAANSAITLASATTTLQ